MHNIYVIHGYTANSKSNWFPYLKENLKTENVKVHIFDMPNSTHPLFKEWLSHLEGQITETREKSIFIGHSLGCAAILSYLMDKKPQNAESIFLVSGFAEKSPIKELSGFMQKKADYRWIMENIPNRFVISAKDDDIVPSRYSEELAEKIKAQFILLKQGGHFIDRDGFKEFPLLVELVRKAICRE